MGESDSREATLLQSMNMDILIRLLEDPRYTKKKIRLRDGRMLSFSECGNIESGIPVLFCFGLMTSSVAAMFAHFAALQNNLRIVAVDYPGIGESTFQEGRSLSSWGDDMNQFCDIVLGASTNVRLLGHSLGGLHALALLSDRTFKGRIARTVLLCPWTYFNGGEKLHPQWVNLAQHLPKVLRDSVLPTVVSNFSVGTIQLVNWSNPQHSHVQAVKIVSEYSACQGNAGNEQMVRLALSTSELYIPSNLQSPVVVYHGRKDQLVLLESVQELVHQMNLRRCNTTLIVNDSADHNNILADPDNLSKVLGSIVGDAGSWAKEINESLGGGESSGLPATALFQPAGPPTDTEMEDDEIEHDESQDPSSRSYSSRRGARSLPTKLLYSFDVEDELLDEL